ncbi:tetrahydrodipicolinate succinyltransferase [Kosakonia sp. S58]|uniref:DapH/DapD/GlmU-related protein n=1 Tax=unclassified Kosakonia TaxID=2632876 RepID=UPI001904F534|nr:MULTISPECIES: DapH/DapD/GlmU-related protein [unclassified Kosakonia]MBK0079818.1 tetrahydrodipicolinate succinyltransferase [Kosakonia sp. S57]MBK0086672.1 tetrahydrodipicolinate succinyltransferase [Kosakonia sp. S58]
MAIQRTGHRYRDTYTGKTIDTWFPASGVVRRRSCLAEKVGLISGDLVEVVIESLEAPPVSTEDAYLRLHLLSDRTVAPNEINLDGIFGLLPNIAWTSAGPVFPGRVDELRDRAADECHHVTVSSVDKFPRMTDYLVPEGVRIADADRVRLGAYLAAGTTVMHEGFVNFNAGTLGESMVEGRVTPGVTVGRNSDVGAGSSIMGTLSGGGKSKNSIGERSLLGANAGIGISLGDECIVEAGLYVTAGTKVKMPDGRVIAAKQLSGQSGLLFRRNSQTGAVEVLSTNSSRWGGLNSNLHSND